MNLNEAEKLLDDFLQGLLSTLGVRQVEPLIYGRTLNEATALLAFTCRVDARGPAFFGCTVSLRFECLEQHLRGAAAKVSVPTVSMPLHLLRTDKNLLEWQFYRREDLGNLRDIILSELRDNAFPFLQQYSTLANLRRKLESPAPKDWFVFNPEQRLNVLAVIRFVQGDKSGALKTLDDALAERRTALPKKRLPIETLRKRLAEAV
jgi:hypothetical protein